MIEKIKEEVISLNLNNLIELMDYINTNRQDIIVQIHTNDDFFKGLNKEVKNE